MSSADLRARDVNHDYLKNVLLKFIAARNTEVSDTNPWWLLKPGSDGI
jgi:hypothetical protein